MSNRNNFFGSKTQYTARTTAFLAATGISDTTIVNALNTMDLALIANGLDTKMIALYPFVGGTATTHKYNFMNPADTDAAFRLTFAGGITHNANGVTGNGLTGFADSHYNTNTENPPQGDFGLSIYSRTNSVGTGVDMGATNSSSSYCFLWIRQSGNSYHGIFDNSLFFTTGLVTDSRGLFTVVRDSATTQKFFQNGSQVAQRTAFNSTGLINYNIYIMARNLFGSPATYSSRNYAFSAIHNAMTATEAANFYTIIQSFQTALSRNV